MIKRAADMKANLAFAVTAISILAATATPSLAAECSNASLKGTYGLATHGERLGVFGPEAPPIIHFYTAPSGDPAPLRVDQVTTENFDGVGNADQFEYVLANGSNLTPAGFVGSSKGRYHVKPDCTGSETLTYPGGFELERVFVLSNQGRTIHALTTMIHIPFLPPAASAGVDCSKGCDLAIQFYSDGERY
jgi:hypothetical protein